jgi:integrase
VSGRRRQVSRLFRGTARDAKKERAALLVEVTKGHHSGTRATLDDLFEAWIIEPRRKGRSPHTLHGYERVYERNIRPTLGKVEVSKITTKRLTDLYGAHQAR